MRITLTSVYVDDQAAALTFYTDVLGFHLSADVPLGEHRWLTVASPEEPDGPELLLEPADHPAVEAYRHALVEDGIPVVQFSVPDASLEYDRLAALGVVFTQLPTSMGSVTTAVFDDTSGNLVQIASPIP